MTSALRCWGLLMSTTIIIGTLPHAMSTEVFEDSVDSSVSAPIYSIEDPDHATSLQSDYSKGVLRVRRQISGEGCVMPQSMENGTYSLRGSVVVIGGQLAPYHSILKLTCPPGNAPSNNGVNFCDDTKNDWFQELARCQKMCKPPKSSTVEFSCTIPSKNGQFSRGRCGTMLPSGTTATPKCRGGHHSITSNRNIFCIDGRWGYSMPTCRAECGKTTPHGTANVINGTNAAKGEFPWHVAVYSTYGQTEANTVPRYWCGGSVISRSLVISAAHCFYDPLARRPFGRDLFMLAVGKLYSDFVHREEAMDPFIQKTGVKRIELPGDYDGELSSYSHDLAILVLEIPLSFSNLIMPVCLNLVDKDFDEEQCSPGLEGTVVGFGLVEINGNVSDILKTATMPIISKNQCKSESPQEFSKYVIWDKICAGYNTGIGVCKGDSGGGLVVSSIERNTPTWYLRGVVSTSPASENNDKCSTNTYSAFTRPFMHKEFIEDVIYKTEGCTMPNNPPNGKFVLIGYRNAAPGEGVGHKSQINLQCDRGFISSDSENNICDEFIDDWVRQFPICEVIPATQTPTLYKKPARIEGCVVPNNPPNGRFSVFGVDSIKPGDIVPPFSNIALNCFTGYSTTSKLNSCDGDTNNWKYDLGTCLKMCDSLVSLSVKFNCSDPSSAEMDQVVYCDVPVPSGSLATPTCEVGHYSNERLPTLVCKDGSWDRRIPKCTEICGRTVSHSPIMSKNKYAKKGEFPWHTAIFRRSREKRLDYRCGGNIISKRHIISTGRCCTSVYIDYLKASELLVVVGKMFSKLSHKEESQKTYIQKIQVKKIEIPVIFGGLMQALQNDLAILVLETPIIFSEYVMPICLDLHNSDIQSRHEQDESLARVAGFGYETPEGPMSPRLKALTLSTIVLPRCREISETNFLKFITPDKVCAVALNGSANLCDGDNGSGLVMSNIENGTTVWYLRGVATVLQQLIPNQKCNMTSFVLFTRPLYHKYFIESVLNAPDSD